MKFRSLGFACAGSWLSLCLVLATTAFAFSTCPPAQGTFPSASVLMYDGDPTTEYSGIPVYAQVVAIDSCDNVTYHSWDGVLDSVSGNIYLGGTGLDPSAYVGWNISFSFLVESGSYWSTFTATAYDCNPECRLTFGGSGVVATVISNRIDCPPRFDNMKLPDPPPIYVSPPACPPTPVLPGDGPSPTSPQPPLPTGPSGPA